MSVKGYARVLQLAFEREYARRDKDYRRGDELRDELTKLGVTLDDKQHMFTTGSGLTGYYILQRGVSYREVQLICLDREEARRGNNYREADLIREQLAELSVQVCDKTKTFTMPDGQQGSYDLRTVQARPHEPAHPGRPVDRRAAPYGNSGGHPPPSPTHGRVPGGFLPPGPVAAPYGPAAAGRPYGLSAAANPNEQPAVRGAGGAGRGAFGRDAPARHQVPTGPVSGGGAGTGDRFKGYFQALSMAIEREHARRAGDYAKADHIRSQMKSFGAEVTDKAKRFTFGSLEGSYDLHVGITAHEAQMVALEREEVRRAKDYAAGDRLRSWLGDNEVQMDDKSHTFTMRDGTSGSYDLYSWTPVMENGGAR